MTVPAGNHVNALRSPGLVPGVARARIELTRVAGDRTPQVYFAYDDFWTRPAESVSVHEPTGREASLWYKTILAEADRLAHRVGLSVEVYNACTKIELHNITMSWNPDQGPLE